MVKIVRASILFLAIAIGGVSGTEASLTSWHFTGVSEHFSVGYPAGQDPPYQLPPGTPVSLDLSFDPSNSSNIYWYNETEYRFAGGDNSLRIQVGSQVSTPINRFAIAVFQAGESDENEVLLGAYDADSYLNVDFPGSIEGGQVIGQFYTPRIITGVSNPNVISPTQPYFGALLFTNYIAHDVPSGFDPSSNFLALFRTVPEPSGYILGTIALSILRRKACWSFR